MPPFAPQMLRLHTFGGCFVTRDGRRLDGVSAQRRGLALLAVIATEMNGISREAAAAMFWPDSDEERARTSLRQLLHSLRSQLGVADLLLPVAELRLNPEFIASDVGDIATAQAGSDPAAAVAMYHGPFLDGFSLKGAEEFERWVDAKRMVFKHDVIRSLESLATDATARGDTLDAVALWRRIAALDPYGARVATALMRALAAADDRVSAVQHAQIHATLIRAELGFEPDASVEELAAQLRQPTSRLRNEMSARQPATAPRHDHAETQAAPEAAASLERVAEAPASLSDVAHHPAVRHAPTQTIARVVWSALLLAVAFATWRAFGRDDRGALAPTPVRASPSTVAVLPFVNTSGDTTDEHLADGLTDELISALGQSPGITVTGRTSAFALKGRGLSATAVADTLRVASIVEGSWRRVGDRLRVTAQLVQAPAGTVVWAETFERDVRDVFAAQSSISGAIATALRQRIAGSHSFARAIRRPIEPAAYDLYLRGRFVFNSRVSPSGVARAQEFFKAAIRLDSLYAQAFAGLSDTYARQAVFGYAVPRDAMRAAKQAALRALALDSTLADAHTSLGHALMVGEFEWAQAERELRTAIALDRAYTYARVLMSICVGSQGRHAEALAQLDTARNGDPLARSINNVLGRTYLNAGRPRDAIATLRRLLELDPDVDLATQQLAYAHLIAGEPDSALAAFRRTAAEHGPRDSAYLAYALGMTGDTTAARRILASLLRSNRADGMLSYQLALAFAGLGDTRRAFAWLERGMQDGVVMTGVMVEPGFASLHGDPRWPALLRRLGLVPPLQGSRAPTRQAANGD